MYTHVSLCSLRTRSTSARRQPSGETMHSALYAQSTQWGPLLFQGAVVSTPAQLAGALLLCGLAGFAGTLLTRASQALTRLTTACSVAPLGLVVLTWCATVCSSEGVVLTSKVVNHIADAVQAQVNLAKLDMHMRQMKKKALPAMKVLGIQAANLLAARSDVRDAKWDPALKAKVRRRCASPLCHSPVPTDGLSADWGAPHALGHRVRHHEGPQQGARSSRWCLSRAQLLTDTSLLRLLDEGRTGAG